MDTIPTVSEQDIRAIVDAGSFQRGKQYANTGAIFDVQRQGMTLKARCHGSRGEAYRVEVKFDEDGIVDTDCTCPIGGYCKHVVALLLVWQREPEQFQEQENLEDLLERYDKADLVSLIKHVIRRYPDVEDLVLSFGKQPAAFSPEVYRSQVKAAFEQDFDWRHEGDAETKLLDIKELGDRFIEQQDYTHAVMVYKEIVDGIIDMHGMYHDGYDEFYSVIDECIEALDNCLDGVHDDKGLRKEIFQILFSIFRHEVEMGGIGFGQEAPEVILRHASSEEREIIAQWVRDSISGEEKWDGRFRDQWYGGYLLELEADKLDDEDFLRICRETGRIHDVVARLLKLGRVNEAKQEAKNVSSYDLLGMADLFVEHGHEDVAERLMQQRAKKTDDTRIHDWLKKYYSVRKNYQAAVEFAEVSFRKRPTLEGYKEIRQLARKNGSWDSVRQELLTFLRSSQDSALLIYIALDEKEIDTALSLLKNRKHSGYDYYYGYGPITIAVAKAAEETQPHASIELYQQYVERLIAQRGRESYREACQYLLKVRELYERIEQSEEWTRYITSLREKNRSLRALKEELAKAGL